MGLLRKNKEVCIGTTCPKCKMKFSESERMIRHMVKAHKQKKSVGDCCVFRN